MKQRQQDAGATREQDAGATREQDAGATREQDTGATRQQDAGATREQDAGATREQDGGALALGEQIRAAILRGEYVPHQRLIEADLCDRFDSSRFLVRSALADLAGQGLVEFQRNRGARVRAVSIDEAIEITEVRMQLEGFTAARAARRIDPSYAERLREIAAQMRAAVEAGELTRYSELNVSLHTTLRELAGHRIAAQLLEQLRALTVRHQFTLSLVPGRSAASLPQHEAIIEAVVRGDAAAAQEAMHAHLRSVIDAFVQLGPH